MISLLELLQGALLVAAVGLLTRGAIRLNRPDRKPTSCPFLLGLLPEDRDSRDQSGHRAR